MHTPRRWLLAALFVLFAVVQTGCITHMPPDMKPVHMQIQWEDDFEAAAARARAEQKPLLMTLIAGDRTGFC